MEDFVKTIDKGIIFGQADKSDFQTHESEQLELERKNREESKKAEEDRKIYEQEKEKQEYEDYLLALEEEKQFKLESKSLQCFGQKKPFVGRGAQMRQLINDSDLKDYRPGMRGRSLHGEQPENLVFKRERFMRQQIHQVNGMEAIQSNHFQMQVWGMESTPSVSSPIDSSFHLEDLQNNSNSAEPSLSKEMYPPLDRPCVVQKKDEFPPLPKPSTSRKHRKSRIAAKFSNKYIDGEGQSENQNSMVDLSSLAPTLTPCTITAPQAVSINDICSLHRVINSNPTRPKNMQSSSSTKELKFNETGFPLL